ncbi:MAG: hypothetical protein EU547_05880, partial [Promethearchaeota archaeon]
MGQYNKKDTSYEFLIILFLLCGLIIFMGLFLPFNNISPNQGKRKIDVFEKTSPILHTSNGDEYSLSYSNYGDQLNTTIHQSKLEKGNPLYIISNPSDPTNNTFSTICPEDKTFNNTYQEIRINNIFA